MDFSLTTYYPLFIYLVAVIGFAVSAVVAAHVMGPKKLTPVKQMPYESGMDPIGNARQRFDVRFYLVAILFIIFDLEVSFLFPWAVAFGKLGAYGFWSMMVFLAVLTIGFIYEWKKGALEWD